MYDQYLHTKELRSVINKPTTYKSFLLPYQPQSRRSNAVIQKPVAFTYPKPSSITPKAMGTILHPAELKLLPVRGGRGRFPPYTYATQLAFTKSPNTSESDSLTPYNLPTPQTPPP